MRKITLSLAVAATVATTGSFAASDLEGAFKEGKTSGQIRAFYIKRDYVSDYDSKVTPDRDAFALGGKLGYETAPLHGVSAGAVFYTSNALGLKGDVSDAYNQSKVDATLFGQGAERPDSTYLGQAYLTMKYGNTSAKLGRQELNTPLAGADDVRMLPNLFEALVVTNTDIPNTTIVGAYVAKEAFGSFANGYYAASAASRNVYAAAYGLQAGYGAGGQTGKFISMSKVALTNFGAESGTNANLVNGLFGANQASIDDRGVFALAAIYKGLPGLTLQAWDYRMSDVLNAIYVQADYTWKCLLNPNIPMTLSGQLWKENGIGQKWAGDVDSTYYGIKLASKPISDLNIYVAYTQTGKDKNDLNDAGVSLTSMHTLNGGMLTPWGGSPGFVQGTVNRLGYTAGTKSWAIGGDYNILPNLNIMARTMKFDISNAAMISYKMYDGATAAKKWLTTDSSETDVDITYKPMKNLELKARFIQTGMWRFDNGSTTTASATLAEQRSAYEMKYNEYRLIANYNF